ncbi:interference hedgehog isoform X2 [Drosophila bipectinata]|uniref:interference hedgehog isoform X2 n=1 Tax=Drosophila bipectinata TaxID=42026 RepID=UPI001C897923|nr:interference hedgehog isoform X2 [Drosophila bipectinata]
MADHKLIPALTLTLMVTLTLVGSLRASSEISSSGSDPLGVYFERAPESAVAPKDDEVVFECELNLKPDSLEWRFRRSGSTEPYRYLRPSAGYNVTSGNEDRAWRLRIYVGPHTVGDYQCVAWYGPGALASTPARLSLVTLALDTSAGNRGGSIRWSVAPKNCILIRCGSVISNPPAIWSFYRNGEKVPQTELLSGAAGALILDSVTAKDAGNYTCAATNAITGQKLDLPQTIELRVDYTDRTPPYFLQRPPTDLSTRPGETIVLECPGVGSPRPTAVWSSPNVILNPNRTKILPYGLQITDVRPEDQGSYVCLLDNGHDALMHIIKLSVLQRPVILRGPASTLTTEGDRLVLECSASGNPQPDIYWLLNGEDAASDAEAHVDNRSLQLNKVQKRHAGVVQCFAKNILGETSEGNMLKVTPLQITGEGDKPLGGVPVRPMHESQGGASSTPSGGGKNKGKRKYIRLGANMVPPSRPNVTRLSDEAVMLRWSVPQNAGLAIGYFKVQYRMLGDATGTIPRDTWQTTSENIPYSYGSNTKRPRGRDRDRHDQHDAVVNPPKNFTYSVMGLLPDRFYRFRIVAVYSNYDNKEGNTSVKFFLQRGSAKSNLPVPELREVEAYSESAVLLHWSLVSDGATSQIDGYFAYYRPADSAGEYLKATVDGGHTRSFKIDQLLPGTTYEFKLQSFNADAASEFSAIRQAKTKQLSDPAATALPTTPVTVQQQNSILPVIAGAAGGGLLLLIATVVACLCLRRKNVQPEEENKPNLEHIQADFVTSAVLGVGGHHKSGDVRRLNGVIPRMNITPNPLAQEAASDKNRNVMELRFLPPLSAANGNGNGSLPAQMEDHMASGEERKEQQTEENEEEEEMEEDDREEDSPRPAAASSSCETLEACDEGLKLGLSPKPEPGRSPESALEAPSKPLPPLPKKPAANAGQATSGLHQNGLHHAQPYHPPGTPTLLHKRLDYHQQPPPVPPHSAYYQQAPAHHHQPSPMMERSVRGLQQLQQQQQHHLQQAGGYHMEEGTPTPSRIPSLRRQRRTSGSQHNSHSNLNLNHNNNNLPPHHQHLHHHPGHPGGLVGIPIVPGSPRVQRSPMPSRAMIKRTRLGSHTDNISSGSLNSIEV